MKVAIYLRTSTSEQNPENQLKECTRFAELRGYEVDPQNIFYEKLSGYKQIERPKYNLIKEKARKGEINAVIVWALDRWVRNRDTLLEDITILRNYGVKIHSVKESWLEAINIEGSLGKTIQEFLLGIIGSLAEMESQRKSERVKIAFMNKKGNWGRPEIREVVKEKVINLHKMGHSYRKIQSSVFYTDKNNHPKNISIGLVHKIISNSKGKIDSNGGVQ